MANIILITLELTVSASAADAVIHKRFLVLEFHYNIINIKGRNEGYHEKNYTLKSFTLLIKGVTKTIEIKTKEQRRVFFWYIIR